MSIECPKCKSPVARNGQRFCYRCGNDLKGFYDSMSIKVNDPGTPDAPAQGSTEVLASEQTIVTNLVQPPSNAKPTLKVLLPTGDVFDRDISSPEIQIGKGPRNDIVLADPAVSTAHATIKFDGQNYIVSDLGSRNGTFVNGERVSGPRQLQHGDLIGLGLSKLTFRLANYSETGTISASMLASLGPPSGPPPLTQESLASALVREGLVSQSDVTRLQGPGGKSRRLAHAVVQDGLVNETALCDLFTRTFQVARVDLRSAKIDEDTAQGFSSRIARDHIVFAFDKSNGLLVLAMADPTDTDPVHKVEHEFKTGATVRVATFGEIAEQIEKYYGPKLIGVLPSGEKLRFPITHQDVEIGKAAHNNIVINDQTVSNTHAVLMVRDGGYSIVDLGSRNGTFVNGERLGGQARTLRHGDKIQLGQTVLTFRNSGETVENQTATLPAEVLEEIRRRSASDASNEAATPPAGGSTATPASEGAADSKDEDKAKKKKKKKKGGTDERLKAAYISGFSRIVAQVLGVVLAVLLALYVNSSLKSGSEKPIIETSGKGKAKVKLAKPGAGFEFTGGVYEASGVVQIPGTEGVYFVDDSKPGQILYMPIDEAGKQAGDIKPIDFGSAVADPESLTYGGSFFYVAGSQSHKEAGERNGLARFAFDAESQTVQGNTEVLKDLRGFLLANVPELKPYADNKGNDGGLNIEGISWDPANDRLLLGLRSPVIDGKALVVPIKLKDPRGPFAAENIAVSSPLHLSIGGQGIRDIQFDSRGGGFLVISGAPVHGESKDFALWLWNGENDASGDGLHQLSTLDGKMKPEGVTRVKAGGREFLFLVGDSSRYMKLDFSSEQ